jgi:ribonuclease HI
MMTPLKNEVIIHTDGACSGNPGPGGWGAILQFGSKAKEIFGYEIDTTNNRMEMSAVIKALQNLQTSCKVVIYTDSKYLHQGITLWIHKWIANNWRTASGAPVKNIDLWQELYKELHKHEISWHWVKGHADNIGNNIADKLAVMGKQEAIKQVRCSS